ncbi:MAG TPA: hypothetical protein VJ742_10155, partial [Nitrososphaera sp.]|nr:hypothetical protein [Nitrososphaera sp.]
MVESIRKWKYATFAVLGVLAIIIATPQANAATKDIHQQLMEAVNSKASQTSVNSLQTTVNSIDTKADNIE